MSRASVGWWVRGGWWLGVAVVVWWVTGWGARLGGMPPEFMSYASSAGRYKGIFPGPVRTEEVETTTADGQKLKVVIEVVELRGGTTFLVSYADATGGAAQVPPERRLDRAQEAVCGPRGQVVRQQQVQVGAEKHPGREIVVERPDGWLRIRMVVVGPRLYQVMVRGSREVVTSPSADRFMEAFEPTR